MSAPHAYTHTHPRANSTPTPDAPRVALAEPTNTVTVRRAYARNLRGVLKTIQAAIREGVGREDAFGLGSALGAAGEYPTHARAALFDADPISTGALPTRAQKQQAFETWLDNQLAQGILEPSRSGNAYIERAYRQGLTQADRDLTRVGWTGLPGGTVEAVTRQPVHRDVLQTAYTRNYQQLRGFTAAADAQMSRTLADGLARGAGPSEISRELASVIGSGGPAGTTGAQARATMIARTEAMNAHQRATDARYEQAGVQYVEVILGPNPCDICSSLEAQNPWLHEHARGLHPQHPNCTCAVAPLPPNFTP